MEDWNDVISNTDKAIKYINSIDLNSLSRSQAIELFCEMILTMYENAIDDERITNELIEIFSIARFTYTRKSRFETYLLGDEAANLTAVSYLLMLRNISIVDAILDLIKWLPNTRAPVVMKNVVNIYTREDKLVPYDKVYNQTDGKQLADIMDVAQIGFLMDAANLKANEGIWNWLIPQYAVNAPIILPGPWIIKDEKNPYIPQEYSLPPAYIDKDPKDTLLPLVEQLTDGSDFTKALTIIEADFRITTAAKKLSYYGFTDDRYIEWLAKHRYTRITSPIDAEIELLRTYGPSNPFFTSDDPGIGQDRMFLCTYYDYNEDLEDYFDNYKGYCDWKGHKITSKRCAVRMPMPGGGWMGWYCSFLCLREKVNDLEGTEAETKIYNPNVIMTMVDAMAEQLMIMGIYYNEPKRRRSMLEIEEVVEVVEEIRYER